MLKKFKTCWIKTFWKKLVGKKTFWKKTCSMKTFWINLAALKLVA